MPSRRPSTTRMSDVERQLLYGPWPLDKRIQTVAYQVVRDAAGPAAPSGAVQWNNSGVMGGSANFTWNSSTNVLYAQNVTTQQITAAKAATGTDRVLGYFQNTSAANTNYASVVCENETVGHGVVLAQFGTIYAGVTGWADHGAVYSASGSAGMIVAAIAGPIEFWLYGGAYPGTGYVHVADITSVSSANGFMPNASLTYYLGDATLYWKGLFAQRLTLNSTAYVDGATAGASIFTGNVGIGGTPTAADNSARTFQVGDRSVIQDTVGNQTTIANNAHYDGAWKYIVTGVASAVRLSGLGGGTTGGDITFTAVASGTAGNTISTWDTTSIKLIIQNGGDVLPGSAGSQNLGNASNYWADISYKTITDRGCLGDFSAGVRTTDGRTLSHLDALREIKAGTKTSVHGVPMLDYSTFPAASQRPAPVAEEDVYYPSTSGAKTLRFAKGEKMGDDGVEMSSLLSIMLGAIRDLEDRIKLLESRMV